MSRIRLPVLLGAASLAALAAAAPARAGGFYIQEQSVRALGRAYSGEAADTGADALWWNPAAIAGVQGVEIYSGAQAVLVDASVKDGGSTITRPGQPTAPVGGDPRVYNPVLFGVVPNGAVAWRVNDRIAVGFTMTSPFDFTSKYPSGSFVRYEAIKSRLNLIDLQPTISYRVTPWLDVAASFDASYADSTLSNALPNVSPLLPDGRSTLSGTGWDFGYTLGAQLHPTSRLNLGLSYRSQIDHTLDGDVSISALQGTPFAQNVSAKGSATFSTPWIATFAARYRLTDQLTVNGQVQRIGWSAFDQINVVYTGGSQVSPQNYQDVTTGAVGLDYDVNRKWTLRAGVEYDPTPTPDVGRTARVPDGDRYLIGVGTTIRPTARMSFDFAAAYIHFDDSQISSSAGAFAGTQLSTPVNVVGTVAGAGAILSAGAHYRF